MYKNNEWTDKSDGPDKPRSNPLVRVRAIANPTVEDTLAIETGFAETNLWLEWMKYSSIKQNKSNCYVCCAARPHLGTVPLDIPSDIEECFFSLYTNTSTNHTNCEDWKQKYPFVTNPTPLKSSVTIYPGNYTCHTSTNRTGRFLGNFTEGYCGTSSSLDPDKLQQQVQALGDIYWICGDMKIRPRLPSNWTGQCALAKILMPLHIMPLEGETAINTPTQNRHKREVPKGSLDPHVYMDTIGVPRGVPDEFKARDQVKAGFESLIPQITINKNVDWINYIYYNQQRFVNYTRDALQGLADQLGPTSTMTFQNRMALDMILAEKGGVCHMVGETCCTYIPGNTGPTGKVTIAIKKLKDLSEELKRNSGITDPWDQYFSWMKNWKQWLILLGSTVLLILVIMAVVVFCIMPCCKGMCQKTGESVTPAMYVLTEDKEIFDMPTQTLKEYYQEVTKLEKTRTLI
ncbi:endogenous retrovirus group FC1 Env polyprotein-like [Rhinophrynus dorsalis]